MKAPGFWYREAGAAAAALAPAAALYDLAGRALRAARTPARVPAFVVCVGNLVAGGAGKTPTALALAALFAAPPLSHLSHARAFLTRGYGGCLRGPVRVDPDRHTACEAGDEALLLARAAPTWLAADRAAGARAAVADGADVLIMDDGYQNRTLARDLNLLVVDGEAGFGNGRVMPAGPLRERVADGLARADAAVLVGASTWPVRGPIEARTRLFEAAIEPAPEASAALAGRRVHAFAGIGRPAKFFDTLARMGCEVVATRAFADHHRYTPDEIMAACEAAAAAGAIPVTTEKDHVRLPPEARAMVTPVPVRLVFRDPAAVASLVAERLQQASRPSTSSG